MRRRRAREDERLLYKPPDRRGQAAACAYELLIVKSRLTGAGLPRANHCTIRQRPHAREHHSEGCGCFGIEILEQRRPSSGRCLHETCDCLEACFHSNTELCCAYPVCETTRCQCRQGRMGYRCAASHQDTVRKSPIRLSAYQSQHERSDIAKASDVELQCPKRIR